MSNRKKPKKSHKGQRQPNSSRQVRSPKKGQAGLPGSSKEKSNNDLSQPRTSAVQQGSQKPLSSSVHSPDEEYCDCSNNPSIDVVKPEIKPRSSEVERSSISCESDSDLEPIPTVSHFKQHTWKDNHSRRTGQSSFDDNSGTKRSFDKDGYVDGKWQNNQLVEINSCQFTHPYSKETIYIRKQSPGYLITFDQEDFIARVYFNKLEELDFAGYLIDTKRRFLKKLIIIEIIRDKLLNDRDAAYKQLKQHLQDRTSTTADNLDCAEDLFQFSNRLEDCRKSYNNVSILDNIVKNANISPEMKDDCQQLLERERALDVRKKYFPQIDQFYSMNLLVELRKICKNGLNNHRNSVSATAQSSMAVGLDCLDDRLILFISNKDMELFADLTDMMNEEPFLDFVSYSWDALLKKLEEIHCLQISSLRSFIPLTHSIYFYLCKSFKELIAEISIKANMSAKDLLKNKDGIWSLAKNINFFSASFLNQSLEQQYRLIFKLIKHFEPGYYSDKSKFEYKPKILQNSDDKTVLQYIKCFFVDLFSNNELSSISQERLVWIYILDNAIGNLLSKEELKLFESLLKGYTNFIEKAIDDHYESFRIVTHNTARFIAQASPYLSKMSARNDQDILKKQIESINKAISDKQFNDFRDLIDVYSEYWKNRESIIEKIPDKFPYGKFKLDMEKIRQKLLSIVNTVLSKKVIPQILIKYFRSFNEFLEDLSALEFSWFVNEFNNRTLSLVELINIDKKSYKVLDSERLIEIQGNDIPRHYLIEIIEDLLNSVSDLLGQQKWCDDDNLNAASELLSAIKKSFLYLKEQPNYVSFDIFKEESTKPFACVVERSISYEDFKKRIVTIGESFWYLRKQDEIDIGKALQLYKKENNSTAETDRILRDCYNRYLDKFNSYIEKSSDKIYQDKIKFITEEVRGQSKSININEWKEDFKRNTLPELLAGLAAVWSIQESKDISSTGKSLKPHCIQILCILRLLSVDKDSEGIDKHLAQVLTGQGKSLVLGLLSSLLALMGHKIRTVCYSKYLATRDQQDFKDFFKKFDICDKITYGTFEDMANEILYPEINGKKQGLRELVEDRILNHSMEEYGEIKQEDISNTILLIDEVDVFFSDEFYGNTYGACNTISIPALSSIQEKIWEMANKGYEKITILKELEEFIKKHVAERNQDFKEFNKFVFKPGKYYLLKKDGGILTKEYTNQSLYEEHRNTMIDNAITVAKGSDKDFVNNRYNVNDDGVISYKKHNGLYSTDTFLSYYNVFNYFRLKKIDYKHKRYRNYGYININCGKVSYAKLPEKYPLILGVSGTLSTLNVHERKAIREFYNINRNSIMPSFFGHSNLKFNKTSDFITQDSEGDWLQKIFNHTHSKVNAGSSVLIFFDTDIEIDKFKKKNLGKFDRLNTLSENTEKGTKEKYIDEAGITKTVTLSTRHMGRGVDFKSSVAVENNGGVHVIQTFFSLDIKEETQIKGRTARKDNKGSYELILCKEHLIKAGFLEDNETTVSYESLNIAREQKIKEKGSNDDKRIKESEDRHNTTIDFFESFFKTSNESTGGSTCSDQC